MIKEQLKRIYTIMLCKRHKVPYCDFKPGVGLEIVNYRRGGVKSGAKQRLDQGFYSAPIPCKVCLKLERNQR